MLRVVTPSLLGVRGIAFCPSRVVHNPVAVMPDRADDDVYLEKMQQKMIKPLQFYDDEVSCMIICVL